MPTNLSDKATSTDPAPPTYLQVVHISTSITILHPTFRMLAATLVTATYKTFLVYVYSDGMDRFISTW